MAWNDILMNLSVFQMDFLASDLEQYSQVAAELDAKLNNIIESSKSLQHRMLPVNRNVTHLQTRRQSMFENRSDNFDHENHWIMEIKKNMFKSISVI